MVGAKNPKGRPTWPALARRLFWIALAFCLQMIYVPASNRVAGGMEPRLPIDRFPIWPVWVIPYLLCYVLWLACLTWILCRAGDRSFRSFMAGSIFVFASAALIFLTFPTYVEPAVLEGTDLMTLLLRPFHEDLGRYAALPSGHVYITTLLALFFTRWYPRSHFLWTGIVVIVSLSTLFTGQHYVLDVLGGYLIAVAGFRFGNWWGDYLPGRSRPLKGESKKVPSP